MVATNQNSPFVFELIRSGSVICPLVRAGTRVLRTRNSVLLCATRWILIANVEEEEEVTGECIVSPPPPPPPPLLLLLLLVLLSPHL